MLDGDGSAEGDLYMDDGRSFAFQRGAFLHRRISFADGKLSSALAEAARGTALTLPLSGEPFKTDVVVERIVVLGLTGGPSGWKVLLSMCPVGAWLTLKYMTTCTSRSYNSTLRGDHCRGS